MLSGGGGKGGRGEGFSALAMPVPLELRGLAELFHRHVLNVSAFRPFRNTFNPIEFHDVSS